MKVVVLGSILFRSQRGIEPKSSFDVDAYEADLSTPLCLRHHVYHAAL